VALAVDLGVATTVIDEHVKPLVEAGFVAHTQGGNWVLAWDPKAATLGDLYQALHMPFAGAWTGDRIAAPWQRQVAPALARIADAEAAAMQLALAELIGESAAPMPALRRSRHHAGEKIGSR
jgi:DNA-binding IscR family transcriptional regulator